MTNKAKETIIPAGYRITVTSWENDADNYNTKVVEGLTFTHAKCIVALCNLFSSKNHSDGIGNMYDPDNAGLQKFNNKMMAFSAEWKSVLDTADFGRYFDDPDEDGYSYYTEYLYGLGLSGSEFFTRVCESIKVEYVPVDIILQDVTEEFV